MRSAPAILLAVAIACSLTSCASTSDKAAADSSNSTEDKKIVDALNEAFSKAIVTPFSRLFGISMLARLFYEKNHRWPSTFKEIQNMSKEAGFKVDLSDYRNVTFRPKPNGDLLMDFSHCPGMGESSVTIARETAEQSGKMDETTKKWVEKSLRAKPSNQTKKHP